MRAASPSSRCSYTELASFTMGNSYDQKDAAGFIRILALPARAREALAARSAGRTEW